ncbi:MAG: hypothetical protein V7K65_13180 [Nostoc sp.]
MLTISFKDALPIMRSAIMRQLLWNLASGDTLTLEDLSVLDKLR